MSSRRAHVALTVSTRAVAVALLAAITLLVVPARVQAEPALMVLESLIRSGERLQTRVEAVPDLINSPHAGEVSQKWSVLPGEAIKLKQRPANRVVHLFRKNGLTHSHLCTINVRYFRAKERGWVPHFQLDETPLVVRRNGRWVPLTTVRGVPTLIVLTSNTLPNVEGFYSSLEFGLTIGMLSIDAWIVR
ncbi:MAG: hypothetical protein ACE5LB_00600 [Acidiferrobacterales bacterium]